MQREDLLLQLSDREQWTIPSSTAELVHLEFAVDSDTLEVLRSFIDDDTVQRSFKDRRTTLELPSTQSTVRTLRLVYELLQVEWQAFMWLSDENPEECMSLFQASFTRLFLKAELVSYLDRDYMQVRMDRYHDDLGLERQPVDWPMLLSNVLPRAGLRRRGKFGPNRGEHLWLPFIV